MTVKQTCNDNYSSSLLHLLKRQKARNQILAFCLFIYRGRGANRCICNCEKPVCMVI